jgi:hypothetical protein
VQEPLVGQTFPFAFDGSVYTDGKMLPPPLQETGLDDTVLIRGATKSLVVMCCRIM